MFGVAISAAKYSHVLRSRLELVNQSVNFLDCCLANLVRNEIGDDSVAMLL